MGLLDQSLISVTALVLGLVMTPITRMLALRWELVDRPAARKVHINPVPLLGGIAIYLAVVFSLAVFVDSPYWPYLVPPLIGGTLISFIGLWDDRRSLHPAARFGAQIVIAIGLIISGFRVELVPIPLLNHAITIFWLLGITNAFNLLDNMDGLSSGVGAVAAFFFLGFSLLTGQYIVGCIAAAVLGACLGFLVFNFNPARIFMGDAGSLFLGFVLALVGLELRFMSLPKSVSWMIPVLVLGLPVFDTTLVTFSRIRRGQPIWVGGKDHVSHRLRSLGWSTRKTVSALYGMATVFGASAVAVYFVGSRAAYGVAGAVLLAAIIAFGSLEAVYRNGRPEQGRPEPAALNPVLPSAVESESPL